MKKTILLVTILISCSLKAQITYVDVNPDSCVCLNIAPSQTASTYTLSSLLDLDSDGVYDFKAYVEVSNSDCMHGQDNASLLGLDSNKTSFNSVGILNLNAGDLINGQSNWGNIYRLEYFDEFSGWTGNWHSTNINTPGFVGVKFYSGSTLYYGWINLIVNTSCGAAHIQINDYAYSTLPIKAGEGQLNSINKYETQQTFIYPNPNNGNFIIEPNNNVKQILQIYDTNGKTVLTQSINGKTIIDGNSLNAGVYNISLLSNEGVANKKLVIVK